MRIAFRLPGIIALALGLAWPGSSYSAPQILGLVATAKPLPLHCVGDTCSVEVSSFCLQRKRKAPKAGRAYHPSAQTVISLIYQGAEQDAVTAIPVTRHVRIFSNRSFRSVKLQIPAGLVKSSGRSVPTISIGAQSAAVPIPREGDRNPQSDKEIAKFTGSYRAAADLIVGEWNYRTVAADALNRLINGLPDNKPADPGQEDRLWKMAIGATPGPDAPSGQRFAAKELKFCAETSRESAVAGIMGFGVRGCLETSHDDLMIEQNSRIWETLDFGS